MRSNNVTFEKSKVFAIRIVNLYKFLTDEKKEFVMAKQILKSGTSIGANLAEAMYGISKNDFLAKLFISLKECSETKYWLELLNKTDYISDTEYKSLDNDCTEILKLLISSARTASKKE